MDMLCTPAACEASPQEKLADSVSSTLPWSRTVAEDVNNLDMSDSSSERKLGKKKEMKQLVYHYN
jgi:hypothetical protein